MPDQEGIGGLRVPLDNRRRKRCQFNGIVARYGESQMFFAACGLGIFEEFAGSPEGPQLTIGTSNGQAAGVANSS